MGFFTNFIINRRRKKILRTLSEIIGRLKVGIYAGLYNRYTKIYDEEYSKILSGAIICELLDEKHHIESINEFHSKNRELVRKEVIHLNEDEYFSKSFSYLYAANIFYITNITGEIMSEECFKIVEIANELNIYIPSTYDISGDNNFFNCLYKISEYANSILHKEINKISDKSNL